MLEIRVEGNEKEIKNAKNVLENDCFVSEDCRPGITCEECEKTMFKIEYIVEK